MAKFYTVIAIFALTLTLVSAEPARFRQAKRFGALRAQNNRKFARQEATPAPAPYPAAGVTPEIPFELPTETEKPFTEPDETYGPPELIPDETYGPPEGTPDETYGPPEETPDQTYGPPDDEAAITEPDSTYGPPENEPAIEELQPADAELVAQNLIQPRKKLVSSRSRSAPVRVRAVQPRARLVEIIRSEPVLVYTLH